MKTSQSVSWIMLGVFGAAVVSGCGASQAPRELVDARAAYTRAQSGPAVQYKPDQLHDAKVALDKAEQSFSDDGDEPKTKDLAYVAQRKSELAEAQARTSQAVSEKDQAEKDVNATTSGQLKQTREQLAATGAALGQTQTQLDAERKARQEADKRAKDAIDKLAASAAANVKQETRGTVITLSGQVLFTSGKSTLLPAAQEKLNQVADALKSQSDHKIVVEGHTDSQGSVDSNMDLSQKRAQAVRDYLVSRGVPSETITAQGFGPNRPIADNKSPEGRANNRRVEIVIQPVEAR